MPAPRKYDAETQERTVRMYLDRMAAGDVSQLAARSEVGELLGINQSTLRNWIRRDVGEGLLPMSAAGWERPDEEMARLRRENAQLRRANEILKTASAFWPRRSSTANSGRSGLHPDPRRPLAGQGLDAGPHIGGAMGIAAQLGTAFMLCPEAGTPEGHREMMRRGDTPTALTRAFTGRTARGISNRFLPRANAARAQRLPRDPPPDRSAQSRSTSRGRCRRVPPLGGTDLPPGPTKPSAQVVLQLAAEAREALQNAAELSEAGNWPSH